MALSAIIFDLDGTLIDSNPAHVRAWDKALQQHGYKVSPDRIAVEIGKGGDKLIPSILGNQIDQRDGKRLRQAHSEEFTKIAQSEQLKVFAGAEPLFRALRQRGLKLALATSSKKDGLAITQQSAKVDWSIFFDAVATGDDATESKPSPAILQAAITKLGLSPAQCAMVGDTPYDADTARDAGAVCLGVTCGGMNNEHTLQSTGMRKVYRDPADMLSSLDDLLRTASPGSASLTQTQIESLMCEALTMARQGLDQHELPIGCIIARGDGTIIARGHNELNTSQNKTAHAEMVTFARTSGRVPTDARDLILVSTLEPCVMCLGAAMEAAVDIILYGLLAPADGGHARVRPPLSPETQMPRLIGGILAHDSRQLFEEFLRQGFANPLQTRFVQELLDSTRQ